MKRPLEGRGSRQDTEIISNANGATSATERMKLTFLQDYIVGNLYCRVRDLLKEIVATQSQVIIFFCRFWPSISISDILIIFS